MVKNPVVKKIVFRRPLRVIRPRKHELIGHLSYVPTLMFLEGSWVRSQVYLRVTTNNRKIYLCPLCVSSNLAYELVTSKDIGIIKFRGEKIRLKVRLTTHQCPNCKFRYIIYKRKDEESPVDDLDIPFVHV